jgi:iron(III) transport system substrate-binding protein
MVASGQLTMGLTDTDDALGAKESGKSVELVFLDQGEAQMGTFVVPNTILNKSTHEDNCNQILLAKKNNGI